MVKDFIINLLTLRTEWINIFPKDKREINKIITKIFRFLRKAYQLNDEEAKAEYRYQKVPNTTQTSFALTKNNKKKKKLNRNCIIHCEINIKALLNYETLTPNMQEIPAKIINLVNNFLQQENKNLSDDWNLISDEQLLKQFIYKTLNIENDDSNIKTNQITEIEVAIDAWEYYQKEIKSLALQNLKPNNTSITLGTT